MFAIRAAGWRFVPHSYAVVNQWQCLELMRRDVVDLYFRDAPLVSRRWRKVDGMLPPKWEKALGNLKDAPPGHPIDCVIRVYVPADFSNAQAKRTLVLGTADFGWFPTEMVRGGGTLAEALRESDSIIISPSQWSRWGLIRAGADPDRIEIVPHGVEVDIFRPLNADQRRSQREQADYRDRFVFLNVSAHTLSKGTDLILKAFARVASQREEAFLVLKGTDAVYNSRHFVSKWMTERLTPDEQAMLEGRMRYVGSSMPVDQLAATYATADAYVTPYRSESFNLPALEAAACGLPVICTAGGPTDDFTTPDFARRISARLEQSSRPNEVLREPDLEELTQAMLDVMDDSGFRARAATAGPAFARSAFTWRHAVDRLLEVAGAPR